MARLADIRQLPRGWSQRRSKGRGQRAESADPGRGHKTGTDGTCFMRGGNPTYLTARIARDRPDILQRLENGQYHRHVGRILEEIGTVLGSSKNAVAKGITPETLAKRHAMPEAVMWTIALEGQSDQERLRFC